MHCHRASRCAAARRARSRAPGTGPPMCGSGSQFRDFFFFCVGARDPHATAPAGGAPASGCLPQAPASGCLPPTRWPHTVTRSLCSHDMPLQLCETTLAVICQDGSLWTIGDCTPPIKHLHCAPARKLRDGDAQTAKDGKRKTMAVCAANGPAHMGVVLDNGELLMRGKYNRGQLGRDPAWEQPDHLLRDVTLSLRDVFVGEKVLQVACGSQHTVVVTSSRRIMTCGDNQFGQLGDRRPCPASEFTHRSPAWRHELDYVHLYPTDTWVYVSESTSIPGSHDGCTGVVAAGDHCLAVTETGNVLAWGVGPPACNDRRTSVHGNAAPLGVLGTFARWQYFMTQVLPGLPGAVYETADGVVHSGEIDYIWLRKENMVFISTSESHAAAVDAHGLLWTWGDGHHGQLGHYENMPMCVQHCMPNSIWHPPSVPPNDCRKRASWHPQLPPIHHVACSNQHTLAVTKHGMVWGWGDNKMRQLAGRNDDRFVELNSGLVLTDADRKTGITLDENGTLSLHSGEILLPETKMSSPDLVPIQHVPRALAIAVDTASASGSTGTASARRYHAVGAAPSGSAAVDEHGQLVVWGMLWGIGTGNWWCGECRGGRQEAMSYCCFDLASCKQSLFDGLRVGLGQGLTFELKLALCMGQHPRLGGAVAHVETGGGAHAHPRQKYMTVANAKARLWHKLQARGWKQEMPRTLLQWGAADRWLMQQQCVLSWLDQDVLCRIVQHSNWSPTRKMSRCAGMMRAAALT